MAYRPELLVLDEPSTGLDPIVRRDILSAIIRTIAEEGRTVLFSSHLLDEVERMADWVAMIDRGRIVLCGPLDEIKAAHRRLTLRFDEPRSQPPSLAGSLYCEGFGRDWTTVCRAPSEALAGQAAEPGRPDRRRPCSLAGRDLRGPGPLARHPSRWRAEPMRSPAVAIAWQIWTRHRLGLSISAVCLLLMVVAFPPILLRFDDNAVFVVTLIPAALIFAYVANLLLFTDEVGSLTSGYPRRMFTLPAATRTLAFWPMLIAVVVAVALWLAIAVLIYHRGGYRPPLVLPAVAIAVAMAWLQTICWLPIKSQLVRVYLMMIGFGVLLASTGLALAAGGAVALMPLRAGALRAGGALRPGASWPGPRSAGRRLVVRSGPRGGLVLVDRRSLFPATGQLPDRGPRLRTGTRPVATT